MSSPVKSKVKRIDSFDICFIVHQMINTLN